MQIDGIRESNELLFIFSFYDITLCYSNQKVKTYAIHLIKTIKKKNETYKLSVQDNQHNRKEKEQPHQHK